MKFKMQPETWEQVIEELIAAGHEQTDDLNEADFLVFNGSPKNFPESLPESLGFVQWIFAGVDGLIKTGAMKPGVRWANAGGVYGKPVAEVALGLIISQYHYFKMATVDGSFERRDDADARQQWLFNNKTVALVGAGGIARELAAMLKPFDARIIAVNRSGNPVDYAERTVSSSDDVAMDEVWEQADVVVLSMPLTQQTHGMINGDVFRKMKPSAIVVNVGRGGLVNTDDLVHALENKEIAGAAMDVTDPEPLPAGHPLWAMDQVIISPHLGAPPSVAKIMLGKQIVLNAQAFERGEKMPTEVDIEAGY